ncbi:cadmium resistance transporter [Sphaerospermopsis aphanizomenoides BCCUSP55]|uniref:cadmium resistance transporter n=1 Tax=Sphaerospermopsis aphanizomenoides TaxID=459663 RepID=UPI001907FA76|nr:cadmium resistance transporter [Sphaerospermopsis aphanizomenoides]MBK1986295.1 cadmium resistance transporter [Sphaerospermopsis aphanizomenoides BCCUSP55]
MSSLITAFTQGMIAFAATNIDDIIILLLFFSQIDHNFRRRHIFIGQYLGFAAIIILSLPGFFGGLVIKREFIGLLGILPIVMGVKQLLNRQEESSEVQTVNTDFLLPSHPNPIVSFLLSILHPNTYKVAAVTIANGGDNISIYIPLFAGQDFASLGIILAVFLGMVGVWCGIAYLLSRQAAIGYILSRYGQGIVPFVLIGLGLFIMYERGTFDLLLLKEN